MFFSSSLSSVGGWWRWRWQWRWVVVILVVLLLLWWWWLWLSWSVGVRGGYVKPQGFEFVDVPGP